MALHAHNIGRFSGGSLALVNLSSQVLLFMNVCTACVRLRYLGNLSATQALKFFQRKRLGRL